MKAGHAKAESIIWHSEDMMRIGICTFGWKSTIGGFPMALVTFIDSDGGDQKDHKVRPFMKQTDGMKAAEHFAKTGEILEQ